MFIFGVGGWPRRQFTLLFIPLRKVIIILLERGKVNRRIVFIIKSKKIKIFNPTYYWRLLACPFLTFTSVSSSKDIDFFLRTWSRKFWGEWAQPSFGSIAVSS